MVSFDSYFAWNSHIYFPPMKLDQLNILYMELSSNVMHTAHLRKNLIW